MTINTKKHLQFDGDSDGVRVSLPIAKAWRIGGGKVVVKCPICGGRHLHGAPSGTHDRDRVAHCPSAMILNPEAPDEYHLRLMSGAPPDQIALSLRRDLPLGDLAASYSDISDGRSIFGPWRNPDDQDDDEPARVLDGRLVANALGCLRRCGAFDEAAALRAELAGIVGRQLWRLAAADVWRRQPGRRWRNRLLHAMRSCYRQAGGPI